MIITVLRCFWETQAGSGGTEVFSTDENAPPGYNPLANPLSQGGAVQ